MPLPVRLPSLATQIREALYLPPRLNISRGKTTSKNYPKPYKYDLYPLSPNPNGPGILSTEPVRAKPRYWYTYMIILKLVSSYTSNYTLDA